MIALLNKYARKTRAYNSEVVTVQSNLAITPSEMLANTRNGIPISSQMLSDSNFYDGEVSRLTDVPFAYRRGVEISDIYAYQRDCRSRVKTAINNSNES